LLYKSVNYHRNIGTGGNFKKVSHSRHPVMLIFAPLPECENLGMNIQPSSSPPIHNAADYIDALLRLPENGTYWLRKVVPGRRMRDKLIRQPSEMEKQNVSRPD
jgi:hypothetical protein